MFDEQVIESGFSVESRRSLEALAEEMPDLRLLVDELVETLEILSSESLLRVFVQAKRASQERELLRQEENFMF